MHKARVGWGWGMFWLAARSTRSVPHLIRASLLPLSLSVSAFLPFSLFPPLPPLCFLSVLPSLYRLPFLTSPYFLYAHFPLLSYPPPLFPLYFILLPYLSPFLYKLNSTLRVFMKKTVINGLCRVYCQKNYCSVCTGWLLAVICH